jgi:hypothetical protein
MSNTVDTAFITEFATKTHLDFQRKGAKLRGTTREQLRPVSSLALRVIRLSSSVLVQQRQ